jgi:hypothetical protein
MTAPAPDKPDVRWLPPDADALQAFDQLPERLVRLQIFHLVRTRKPGGDA